MEDARLGLVYHYILVFSNTSKQYFLHKEQKNNMKFNVRVYYVYTVPTIIQNIVFFYVLLHMMPNITTIFFFKMENMDYRKYKVTVGPEKKPINNKKYKNS